VPYDARIGFETRLRATTPRAHTQVRPYDCIRDDEDICIDLKT
jgi:hypothetical protein